MAEGYEESFEILVEATVGTYGELVQGYAALPIPIALPTTIDLGQLQFPQGAVVAAEERMKDLPAHPVAVGALSEASYLWVTGTVAFERFQETRSDTALAAAAWSFREAMQRMDLALALLRQE